MNDLFNSADFLPGISLHQPYAGLVRLRIKELETRMYQCHKRGPVVICATSTFLTTVSIEQRAQLVPDRVSTDAYNAAVYLTGCVIALANLVDCRLLTKADEPRSRFWSDADAGKRYAWELQDIQPLVPRKIRCMPGWFPVPRALVEVAA
jgi:hypothetical protein